MSKHKKRKLYQLPVFDWDVEDLKTASWHHWQGNYAKASKIFFPLMARLIIEPLKDSEEYRDGERKQAAPVAEQQEETEEDKRVVTFEDLFSAGDPDPDAPQPQRDKNGYLVEDHVKDNVEDENPLLIR